MTNCHHLFTHNDLDGAGSVLVYMWNKPKTDTFQYTPISNLEISKLKREISNTHNPSNISVLDLSLREEFLPELDQEYITIIDHHKSTEDFIPKFKKSKIIYKNYTSNTLLMYKLYKQSSNLELTQQQKLLVALINDFDCYKLELKDSYDLNMLFWSEYQNRFSDFIKDYYNGFKPFTENQKRAINYIKKEAANEASKAKVYYGDLNIGGKIKKTCACMVERIVPQVIEVLAQKYKPDLFFFINIKNEKVSIRQYDQTDPIDCGVLAKKICEGGGHSNAAAGKITPLFMELTKNLKPI
ncbi:hypothetical protein EBU91_00845 [bacterium]|nr:hypothetical protein [bacterium]